MLLFEVRVYVCFVLVLVFLFFFFKQKTAYEMRISDWSSDVCSSDLLGAGFFVAQFLGGPDADHAFCGHAGLAAGGRAWRSRKLRPHQAEYFQQIGRASCRERVCQYV